MKKKIIGFTCGSFDLTHAGHFLMFEECKRYCDFLIVGLQTDPSIDRKGKNKPIQSPYERFIQLRSCKWIDIVVLYQTEADLLKLLQLLHFIDGHLVRFIGADWKGKYFTGHKLPIKVIFNSRDHNFSSKMLRRRVLKACSKSGKNCG